MPLLFNKLKKINAEFTADISNIKIFIIFYYWSEKFKPSKLILLNITAKKIREISFIFFYFY